MPETREQSKNATDVAPNKSKNTTDWVTDKAHAAVDAASNAAGTIANRACEATRSVTDAAMRTKDRIGNWIHDRAEPAAEEYMSEAYDSTKKAMSSLNKHATEFVKTHPLAAVGIGFGIGLLVGRALNRS